MFVEVDAGANAIVSLQVERTRQPPTQAEMSGSDSAPRKSPNGQWAILEKVEGAKVVYYLLDANGKQISSIYEQSAQFPSGYRMWSPDGQWLVYQPIVYSPYSDKYLGDLYIYEPTTRTSRQLTNFFAGQQPPTSIDLPPYPWSPDGEWFMFTTDAGGVMNQLCAANVKHGAAKCYNVQWKNFGFVWSRDSWFIAFIARMGENQSQDLYILEVANGQVRNLTNDGDAEYEDEFTAY